MNTGCPRCGRLPGNSHTEICALQGEIERLRHDIERHIRIASELATENERLTSALTDILNPLGRMQREAAANGCRLNGMAVHLMDDAQYLKEIAKEALATPSEERK